jgi:alpha-glucosidase (family GH31 glycosyl hydrolase)
VYARGVTHGTGSPRFALASVSLALGLAPLVAASCGDDTTTTGTGTGGAGGGPDCAVEHRDADDAAPPLVTTPRWAFRPWISKDISDTDDSRAFVQGFRDRDIPVGVLVIDSPWETNYNTFEPNPSRYPEFGTLVSDLKEQGVRTVVWTTQMINTGSYDLEPGGDFYQTGSPDHAQAQTCGWFVNDAHIYGWWKGQGSAIDFFDPDARAYWHRMQDRVLDLGIAGFKLDFGESYIDEIPIRTDEGEKTLQEYSEAYYRDFYTYGSARSAPGEFVTMVRPYDQSYLFEGRFFARPEDAPVTWVGDNRRDYVGMQDALDHIMRSALAGYVVVGSDIGGYLDRDDVDLTLMIPFDTEVFLRWTAMGAMMPFMELHSRSNLTPWSVDAGDGDVIDAYRFWATLHEQLVPFFDSVATAAYAGGPVPMIEPVGTESTWPNDYRYWLGGALLVVPVVDGTGARDIEAPSDARYFDLFDAAASPIAPGTVLSAVDVSDATRIPVLVREGAIIPLEVSNDATPFGNDASQGALTVLAFPSTTPSSFDVVAEDDSIELTVDASRDATSATLSLGAHPRPLILRVRVESAATSVQAGGTPLTQAADRAAFDTATTGWLVDGGFVWVKLAQGAATTLVLE